MKRSRITSGAAAALCLAGASQVFASPLTDPIFNVGVIGSHTESKLTVDGDSDKDRLNRGGLYANYGNKLTGLDGLIYQVGVEGQYRDKDDVKHKRARFDLDVGLRGALSANNYVDFLVGGGYDWGRNEAKDVGAFDTDVRLTSKSPFAKAAVGYNYLTPDYTVRLEAGARYSIDAEVRVKVDGESRDVDLKDKVNPYAELTVLWNKGVANLPISTTLYYNQTNYKLDGDSPLANVSKLKEQEVGVRLGMAF